MTKDNAEIREFVTNYRDFLVANNINVAHSTLDNKWFVYQYQERYCYYEFFTQFSTATELVDIILDEMEFMLYCAVKKEVTPPPHEDDDILDILQHYNASNDEILRLTQLVDLTLSSEYGKDSKFFQMLDQLISRSSRIKGQKQIL